MGGLKAISFLQFPKSFNSLFLQTAFDITGLFVVRLFLDLLYETLFLAELLKSTQQLVDILVSVRGNFKHQSSTPSYLIRTTY